MDTEFMKPTTQPTPEPKEVSTSTDKLLTYFGPADAISDPTSGKVFNQGVPTPVKKEDADRVMGLFPGLFVDGGSPDKDEDK